MRLRTITIDLAKTVFQACDVNEHTKPQIIFRFCADSDPADYSGKVKDDTAL